MQWEQGIYRISDQLAELDVDLIHTFLSSESYWARGISQAVVVRSLEQALCFGLFRRQQQIDLARVITDRATFAYLANVFVLPAERGRGLGKWLLDCTLSHPDLQGLRRWMLATGDAHGLYQQFGFTLSQPGLLMQKVDPQVYEATGSDLDDLIDCSTPGPSVAIADGAFTVVQYAAEFYAIARRKSPGSTARMECR